MLEKIQTNIRFGNPTIHEITLFDKVNEKYFIPKGKEGSKSIDKDYGGIIKTANPFAQDKQVLIIAGSYGYGTWAGVRFTTSEEFIKNKAVAKNKPIECIIETDIVRRTPQKIQCLFLREINKAPVHHDTSTIH